MKQLQNDLCYRIWEMVSCTVSASNSISHEITILDVLHPYFSECCRIMKDLEQWSIKFGKIEQLFHQDDDPEKLKLNLLNLYQDVESGKSKTPSSPLPKWIEKAAMFMKNYWNLRCSGDMCQTILNANNTVLSLYDRFKIGKVSIKEVKIAVEYIDQLKLLFDCSTEDDDNRTTVSPTALECAIKDREEECGHFRQFQALLLNLYQHISHDQVEGE